MEVIFRFTYPQQSGLQIDRGQHNQATIQQYPLFICLFRLICNQAQDFLVHIISKFNTTIIYPGLHNEFTR